MIAWGQGGLFVSYFAENYPLFRYPLGEADGPGLRLAQLGAIHASAAHFAVRTDPGIVTMPTGSGKTAVLIAAAFVLRAQRVLVVAPSRLVREQIAAEAASLSTLRAACALTEDVPPPRVVSVKKRITNAAEWEALRKYDVVVGTVQSISPAYREIPEPPADLFDVVLVDEAHHSPARTWHGLLSHFGAAKRLLFTATPFRQDQREIRGRFIFTYDLRKAFEDGVFGEIIYRPVTPAAGQNHDVAIAVAAERQYISDRNAGLRHHLMVRTDSRKRAAELFGLYEKHTRLRLSVVTGDKSLRYVTNVIERMNSDELDGIICVNMLGEGFDFPSLKVAAIHSPHRSLNVTLQFIGRFARTAGDDLGPASFLAVPSEIEIEAERLYDTRAVWQEVVQNLSATRVVQEAETREVLESFSASAFAQDLTDLSLYVLEPYYHVKVYQLDEVVDLTRLISFPEPLQVVYQSVSEAHNAAIYVTREISLPRWTTDDRLSVVQPDLFILYQEHDSRLLFICASRRAEGLYQHLAATFTSAHPRPLPLVRLNRALNDLTAPEFFNVGMRNRVASNTTESYRIVTGSNADKVIGRSDARLYHRGHAFGRGTDNGELVTIGLSSASKIWSNRSSKLPDLIDWCQKLAARIDSDRTPITGSGLDLLDVGEEIDALPPAIVAVDWPSTVHRNPPIVKYLSQAGEVVAQLLDFDLSVDAVNDDMVLISVSHDGGFTYRATFSFNTDRYIEPASANEPSATVEREREVVGMVEFLNGDMPLFYTSDLSLVDGNSLLRAPHQELAPFDDALIEAIDWAGLNVDIQREFGEGTQGRISVHQALEERLQASDSAVVYYDHGSGEIADFVALDKAEEDRLIIRFFHCKGSAAGAPGHRLSDVYELAGQAVKSTRWALKGRVLTSIRRRFKQSIGSHRFVKGDLDGLEALLTETTAARIEFEFIAVQPGIRKAGLPIAMGNVLAAANDHLVRAGFRPLQVLASA